MNVDELRSALATIADEATGAPAETTARLSGIDAKASAARRRAAGGAVAAVAVVVAAAVALAPVVRPASDAPPAHPTAADHGPGVVATDLPTLTDGGATFYTDAAGATLLGHAVGAPGQASVTVTIDPASLYLGLNATCWRTERSGPPARFAAFVGGTRVEWGRCDDAPYGPLTVDDTPGGRGGQVTRQAWRDLGAAVGQPLTLSLRLTGDPGAVETSQLVAGLFTAAPVDRSHGIAYPDRAVFEGHEYQSVQSNVSTYRGAHHRDISQLPPSHHPLYVLFGTGNTSGGGRSRVVGAPWSATGGAGGILVDPAEGKVTTVFRGSAASQGTLYTVVYEQAR